MNDDLNFVSAVRVFLLRKNLASLPFELAGAFVAFFLTMNGLIALVALFVGDLIGDQIGRRIAHRSSNLNSYTVEQVKNYKDSRRIYTLLILIVPVAVFAAAWLAGAAINQSLAVAAVAWSFAALAYRYGAHVEARRGLIHA
jgi:MFS family permease